MNAADCLPGSTFVFRKPTKAIISKNGLDVEKEEPIREWGYIQHKKALRINGTRYDLELFGSTVLFGGACREEELPDGLEGASFYIIDKERVKRKDTIRHLIGSKVHLPFALLHKPGRIIDLTKLPSEVQANLALRMHGEEVAAAVKYDGKFRNPVEFRHFIRRNAPAKPGEVTAGHLLEATISNLCRPAVKGNHHSLVCTDGGLMCECGYRMSFTNIMDRLVDHTHKKRYVNPYTITCSRCRHKYKLVDDGENGLQFVTVKKKSDARLQHEDDWFAHQELERNRLAEALNRTRRRNRRRRRRVQRVEWEFRDDDEW